MIFFLLVLCVDSKELGIFADYSKSCEPVYIQVTKGLLNTGDLAVLARCYFPHGWSGLPSWTPDYSQPIQRWPIDYPDLDGEHSLRASGRS
jgi:hypothetical protein